MTDVFPPAESVGTSDFIRCVFDVVRGLSLLLLAAAPIAAQSFFPLKDVRPGMHGVGRTVFEGNRIEEFQVEILGVLQNLAPKQSIILAKLSGGPLGETGVMEGMSGSPVYIGGKLLGAVALGFPFSKEPIAGIQPIEQMVAGSSFKSVPQDGQNESGMPAHILTKHAERTPLSPGPEFASPLGNLTEILTPLSLSGFPADTLQAFASDFRKLGFLPQQGVSGGTPISQEYSGTVSPGSMISVQLLSGDMNMSADGTVTYVDGTHIYAFGHRFLDAGSIELPFARAEVVALVPTLNSSFKVSRAEQWVGSIVSDRNTAIAGEIGRRAHTIPVAIHVNSSLTGTHDYHFQVVNNRLLTTLITQTVVFSAIDATERSLGAATLRVHGRVEFEGDFPALNIRDMFVGDVGLAQQVAADAVVPIGFVLGAGFKDLRVKRIEFTLDPVESRRQLRIAQVWASRRSVRPGESVEVTASLQGENGIEFTRSASYRVPVGAPLGALNFTVTDANGLNFPDFAGLSPAALHDPMQMIQEVNRFRDNDAAYVRVWRQEPAFTISGPAAAGELTDPPPSVMLILADPSGPATTSTATTLTRGSGVDEMRLPVPGYVVSGSGTIQVEVKE